MDWNQTRTVYLEKMEKASALADRTLALCRKTPAEIPPTMRSELEKIRELVGRQEEKLKANRFEVAVLGLEKAGKSTLLNAWLGTEILPAMDERCTYTSCEVWSAPSEKEQLYAIEYYSPVEFEQQLSEKRRLIQDLPPGNSDRNQIEQDVKEIEAYQSHIQEFLKQDRFERKFDDVNEIREDLKLAIATNKAQARSIKRIVLKTVKLRADRDIVFHDVPGFNSPLQLHKTLAEDKLKRCDAILYAKEHDKPDLVDSEIKMLQIADEEDPHIQVAEKIFIALTRADKAESRQKLDERIQKAQNRWTNVPEKRIVAVCPPAHLFKLGTCGPDIQSYGSKIIRDLEAMQLSDGISELKDIVNLYIDTDRAQVLERRCKGMLHDTASHVGKITEILLKHYPDNPEELALTQDDEAFNIFITWWKAKWEAVKSDFNDFYMSVIMPKEHVDAPAQEHVKLREFQAAFNTLADGFTGEMDYSDEKFEQRYRLLGSSQEGIVHPQTAHIELRRELHQQALNNLNQMSAKLAETLENIIGEVGDWVYNIWKIEDIRRELLKTSISLHERLEHGMATLFLRFARPAVNLFLNHPRGHRSKYLEIYHPEVATLKEFYRGTDQTVKLNLERFLASGPNRTETPPPPDKAARPHYLDAIRRENSAEAAYRKEPQTLEEVKTEIREDIAALNDYLKNSIFYAAGFIAYCRQELDVIKGRFLNNETRWQQLVRAAYRRKHPLLMAEKALNINDYEFRRGVITDLAEVQKMLVDLRKHL